MTARHLLLDTDVTPSQQAAILDTADELKALRRASRGAGARPLAGRSVALVFEKPSTRTRMSFEVGVVELGGHPVVLDARATHLDRGETLEDTAHVMSRYVDAIVMRTFAQERLEQLASAASVPVVNALSDFAHPCQALADLQTIREKRGVLAGQTLAYLGDGNNVAHSLLLAGAMAGMRVHVASPPGYEPFDEVVRGANAIGATTGGEAVVMHDPHDAVAGADVVYTDVWASMGQEGEVSSRALVFQPYQVNEALLEAARDDAIVMHCLPAHRDSEISAAVFDGPRSVVFDQAENRLHAQKALLTFLLEDAPAGAAVGGLGGAVVTATATTEALAGLGARKVTS
jgi:ornithine carbamoyltransferase